MVFHGLIHLKSDTLDSDVQALFVREIIPRFQSYFNQTRASYPRPSQDVEQRIQIDLLDSLAISLEGDLFGNLHVGLVLEHLLINHLIECHIYLTQHVLNLAWL